MVNEKLIVEVQAAIRESARSHGVKRAGIEALWHHFNEKTSRRFKKKSHQQLARLICASEKLKGLVKFEPTPIKDQIARHAAQLREMLADVRG